MPNVGQIYVVTDGQRPAYLHEFAEQGLCAQDQIQVIDHQQLFAGYSQYLPTFNSLSIETMLWNIDGLSEHFIYMNDDFFFNQPSDTTHFIAEDGKVQIYGHWQSNTWIKLKYLWRKWRAQRFNGVNPPKYTVAQMLSADMLGLSQYLEVHHRPHLLQKSIFKQYFAQHPQQLQQQIQHRFRDADQFLPVGLCNHIQIVNQQANVQPDLAIAYLKNSKSIETFLAALNDQSIRYGCIQSLDQIEADALAKVTDAMQHKFADYLPKSIDQFKS